jgi:hypothetical protein
MASNIRERAREILSIVPVGRDIASVGATASLFTRLTGLTQATLQRDKTAYDPNKLEGWTDIELYFDAAAAQTVPLPPWLPGWCKVMWRSQPFYYYFDLNNQVKWTQVFPVSTVQPPSAPRDTGSVAVDTLNRITIRWGATGSIEKLSKSGNNQMNGTWNGNEALSAAKM